MFSLENFSLVEHHALSFSPHLSYSHFQRILRNWIKWNIHYLFLYMFTAIIVQIWNFFYQQQIIKPQIDQYCLSPFFLVPETNCLPLFLFPVVNYLPLFLFPEANYFPLFHIPEAKYVLSKFCLLHFCSSIMVIIVSIFLSCFISEFVLICCKLNVVKIKKIVLYIVIMSINFDAQDDLNFFFFWKSHSYHHTDQ